VTDIQISNSVKSAIQRFQVAILAEIKLRIPIKGFPRKKGHCFPKSGKQWPAAEAT
jgi:hypothetical protein